MLDNTELMHTIRAVFDQEPPTTTENAQKIIERLQATHNRRKLENFDGLSPEQMAGLLYTPFECPQFVTVATQLPTAAQAPILELYGRIANAIGEKGLKATASGNLPRKLVREAAFARFPEDSDIERHVFTEADFPYLHGVRLMAGLAGLIRKQHGKFLLTAKARKLHASGGAAAAFPELFKTFARRFNWGYWDALPELPIVQNAFMFSLLQFSRYGAQPRPESYYADAFLRAFPLALQEPGETPLRSPEELVRMTYEVRTFRFLELLGFAEQMETQRRLFPTMRGGQVRKLPLLDACIQFMF